MHTHTQDVHKEAAQELQAQAQRDQDERRGGGRDRRGGPPGPPQRPQYDNRHVSREDLQRSTLSNMQVCVCCVVQCECVWLCVLQCRCVTAVTSRGRRPAMMHAQRAGARAYMVFVSADYSRSRCNPGLCLLRLRCHPGWQMKKLPRVVLAFSYAANLVCKSSPIFFSNKWVRFLY
jgi:hypothetical protein